LGYELTKSEGVGPVGLIVRAISFQDFQVSNPCRPDQPTSQTDGPTDSQHAIAIPRFALLSAQYHRFHSANNVYCRGNLAFLR